jgi:thiamine biosynthesis lipoprotein
MKNTSTKMTTTATTVLKATMTSQARLRQAAAAEQWRQHRFRAMNTEVHTWVFGRNEDAAAQVAATFHQQERTMSRFDAASELSRLNQSPDRQVTVSPALFAPLAVAFWAAEATGGLFDPTLLTPLQAAGYDRSFELIVERAAFRWTVAPEMAAMPGVQHRPLASWRQVTLLPETQQVRRPVGLGIDLGGMGKGWAVDRAADLLNAQEPFLVNAGGDLFAHGHPGDARGWRVAVEHPLDPARWVARLRLTHHALATSTVMKRRWLKEGQTMHHLIDPRTGRPAVTDALSVSVVAERTVVAEVLAKAALILGAEDGLAWLGAIPGVAALMYTSAGALRWTPSLEPMIEELAADAAHGEI